MDFIKLIITVITGIFVYFFNGCFSPPPPITITTPKITTREIHVNWENHLVIGKNRTNYQIKYGKIKQEFSDSLSLNNYFTQHNNELLRYKDSLAIRDNGMTEKQFRIIISVLRNHNFYKYQLLVDKH